MKRDDKLFAARNADENEAFAVEDLVFDVHLLIEKMMRDRSVTQAELAKKLGCSRAYVSQLLSTKGSNITIKTLARIAHALDERVVVDAGRKLERERKRTFPAQRELVVDAIASAARSERWQNVTAVNDNWDPSRVAA